MSIDKSDNKELRKVVNSIKKDFKETKLKHILWGIFWMVVVFMVSVTLQKAERLSIICEVSETEHFIGQTSFTSFSLSSSMNLTKLPPNKKDYDFYVKYYNDKGGKPPWHSLNCKHNLSAINWSYFRSFKWIKDLRLK